MQIEATKLKEGRIEKTGQMVIPRFAPTAILLKNGKVLVFGGQVDSNSADFKLGEIRPNQAEIYDSESGKFSLTGKANLIREEHTTTLLQDGRVLITGGDMGLLTKDEIEIYNPETGDFSLVDKLKNARKNHQATLLHNGKVLITGGDELNPKKYQALGMHQYQIHNTAELFDPKTNTTELLKSKMHYPRVHHQTILLKDGRVLIIGGVQKDSESPSDEVELYDPKTNTFAVASKLLIPSVASPIPFLLKDGTVLLAGGKSKRGQYGYLSDVQVYNPQTDKFIRINSMNFGRSSHLRFLPLETGEVLVVNGIAHDPFHPIDELEIFNPITKKFRHIGTHYHARTGITLPNRSVLFVGKTTDDKASISAELYTY